MGATFDKIHEFKACKDPQVQEERKKSEHTLLCSCLPCEKFFGAGKPVYAFYISDVEKYDEEHHTCYSGYGAKAMIVYSSKKDIAWGASLLLDKKDAKTINDFAFSNSPIKKECLIEATQDVLKRWADEEDEYVTHFNKIREKRGSQRAKWVDEEDEFVSPFYELDKKYNLKKMKYALLVAKRKVLGE